MVSEMSKIISQVLLYSLSTILIPAFANIQQPAESNNILNLKSLACDDTNTHCVALTHTSIQEYSLALYKTDDAGKSWYELPTDFYMRIGLEKSLDSSKGMHIACDQYLQNCLIGLTILKGHAYIFYGTNNGGQSWKSTIIDHEPDKTMSSVYITQLTCNTSSASQCHLLTNTNDTYFLEPHYDDLTIHGPFYLNISIRPMVAKSITENGKD